MFSAMCCLEDNAPGTVRQTQWLDLFNRDPRCDRWLREEDMLERWVIFTFLCLVQVTRIYIAVEETLLGFVLASKRVPRCKEEAVLYKRMDRFCAKLYNLTVRSVQTHKSL